MTNDKPATRLDLLIAFLIALASITTALVTWRSTIVGSSAGDAVHKGLIAALKKEAAQSENLRSLYQEALAAQNYSTYAAGLSVLENSKDPVVQGQAKPLKQFMLPSLAQLSPLVNNAFYQKRDGTYNLDKRLADLEAAYPDLAKLDPEASFKSGDQYAAEQRWLIVDIVLFVVSLFWLTLAQITARPVRIITLAIGVAIYVFGLFGFAIIQLFFVYSRGSL